MKTDFAGRLRALGLSPKRDETWLLVGAPRRCAGWKLHISSSVAGVDRLFQTVVPLLARFRAQFKIAADQEIVVALNAGELGETQVGKIITIYPRHDREAVVLAGMLIEQTRDLLGPLIATDLHLGGTVYTRYGAIRPRVVYDRFGEPTDLIPDGAGEWMPDLRAVPFTVPRGVSNPFPTGQVISRPSPPDAMVCSWVASL